MKKTVIFLTGFYTFMFFVITAMFNGRLVFSDYLNILYLNTSQFEAIGLMKFNIQFIISYLLVFSLILLFIINNVTEFASFFGMVFHRNSKIKTLVDLYKHCFFKITVIFSANFALILIMYLACTVMAHVPFFTIITSFVYLARYYISIFIIVLIHESLSVSSSDSRSLIILNFIYLILIIFDIVFESHIITYSNTLSTEILYGLVTIVIGVFIIFVMIKSFLRRKDIT